jgi:hypothetical protein
LTLSFVQKDALSRIYRRFYTIMSTELAEKKKQEEEALTAAEAEEKEAIKTDCCPHCTTLVSNFPYIAVYPIYGWIECAACGTVFCPKSVRDLKIKRAKSPIIT